MIGAEEILKRLKAHNKRLAHLERIERDVRVGVIAGSDNDQAISADTWTVVDYNLIFDPFGVLTGDALIAVEPVWVMVTMIARTEDTVWKNRDEWSVAVMVDSAVRTILGTQIFQGVITTTATVNGSTIIYLDAGEELEFAVYSTVATALSGDVKENKVTLLDWKG